MWVQNCSKFLHKSLTLAFQQTHYKQHNKSKSLQNLFMTACKWHSHQNITQKKSWIQEDYHITRSFSLSLSLHAWLNDQLEMCTWLWTWKNRKGCSCSFSLLALICLSLLAGLMCLLSSPLTWPFIIIIFLSSPNHFCIILRFSFLYTNDADIWPVCDTHGEMRWKRIWTEHMI